MDNLRSEKLYRWRSTKWVFGAVAVLLLVAGFLLGRAGSNNNSTFVNTLNGGENTVVNTVQKVLPSVVSVVASKDIPVIERCFINPFRIPGDSFFGIGSRVPIECQQRLERRQIGGGSGFVVRADGLIITNNHVVADEAAEYAVVTSDGEQHSAVVVLRDPARDLAIIHSGVANLKPLPLGNSDNLRLGETVVAIGNALGEFPNTVSVGVISGLSREITAGDQSGVVEELKNIIQTDAAINPGNSGGPLMNIAGEVIGVNTAIAQGAENIGFAVPINDVLDILGSLEGDTQ